MALQLFCALVLLTGVHSRTTDTGNSITGNDIQDNRVKPEAGTLLTDLRFLYRMYEECSATDLSSCLKKKLIIALDRAGKTLRQLTLIDGISFVKDSVDLQVNPTPLTENDLESSLPRSLSDRDYTLNQMIFDKIISFFETHTLEFKLFESADKRSLGSSEARRRNRLNSLLMVPLLLGGTLIPLSFGALALLAGKALIVSKLALALAAIVGLKKLVGGGGGGGHSSGYQVVSVPTHHGGGHYRKRRSHQDAPHVLAYKGHLAAGMRAVHGS